MAESETSAGMGMNQVYALSIATALALALTSIGTPSAPVGDQHNNQQSRVKPNELEDLTSTELRERIAQGTTTILVPIGGTEQNGAHMVLGKHNVRARLLANKIAAELGNAIVAPTLSYVPEGNIHPPSAHMKYTGTISIPEPVFEAILEAAARSFKQHGFKNIVLLGDHGGYQASLARVVEHLQHEWAKDTSCRAFAPAEYYRATQTTYVDALKSKGFSEAEIGNHAGLADTSLSLALEPRLVRSDALAATPATGVSGQPRRSNAALGELGIRAIVEQTVGAVRREEKSH